MYEITGVKLRGRVRGKYQSDVNSPSMSWVDILLGIHAQTHTRNFKVQHRICDFDLPDKSYFKIGPGVHTPPGFAQCNVVMCDRIYTPICVRKLNFQQVKPKHENG